MIQEETQQLHNWMYSFMPRQNTYGFGEIYLVGFCKNCKWAFSENLPTSAEHFELKKMAFPKFGCKPVQYD